MTFPEFLESRVGTTLAYTIMGAVVGAVGWPIFLVGGKHNLHTLMEMTGPVFWCTDLEAAVFCAGLGFICGARPNLLFCTALGFVLGLLLTALAVPLDLYAFYYPEGVATWVVAVFVAVVTLFGLIAGMVCAEASRMEEEQSLPRIRRMSRRR